MTGDIRKRYLILKKRRRYNEAIAAIAKMLLAAIYNVLKKDEPCNPDLYLMPAGLPYTGKPSSSSIGKAILRLFRLFLRFQVYLRLSTAFRNSGFCALFLNSTQIKMF